MSVLYGLQNVEPSMWGGAVALGVFDGVHWGHQAIFSALTNAAKESSVHSIALTFDRHPAELLAPAAAPKYISTLEQRMELIAASGVETVLVVQFDSAFAALTRDEFLRGILHEHLHVSHVVVGSNFVFGEGRRGDIRYLSAEADSLGISVTVAPSVVIDGGPVSSTRIRGLIGSGDVVGAAHLLGRQFTLRGRVVAGREVGRKLGFPTANLAVAERQVIPARGVYAVRTDVDGVCYSGVCNIGLRPTFGDGDQSIEVHLIGFDGNLYERILDVVFVKRLRDEMTFGTTDELIRQIGVDIDRVKQAA